MLLSVIGVIVTVWRWSFHAAIDLTWWPDYFAGKLMPLFLLVVMFLPRVRRVFAGPKVSPGARPRVDRKGTDTHAGPALVDHLAGRTFMLDRRLSQTSPSIQPIGSNDH